MKTTQEKQGYNREDILHHNVSEIIDQIKGKKQCL